MKTKYFSVVILAGLSLGIYNCSSMDSYGVKKHSNDKIEEKSNQVKKHSNDKIEEKSNHEANASVKNQNVLVQQNIQPEKNGNKRTILEKILIGGLVVNSTLLIRSLINGPKKINQSKINAFNGTHMFVKEEYSQQYDHIVPFNTLFCTPMYDQAVTIDRDYNISEKNLYTFKSYENINLNRFCRKKMYFSTFDPNACSNSHLKLKKWNYIWAKQFSGNDPCIKKDRIESGKWGLAITVIYGLILCTLMFIFLNCCIRWINT